MVQRPAIPLDSSPLLIVLAFRMVEDTVSCMVCLPSSSSLQNLVSRLIDSWVI
jgi:hypothetical protein